MTDPMTVSPERHGDSVLLAAGIDEKSLLYAERQLVKQGRLAEVASLQQKRFGRALYCNAVVAVFYFVHAAISANADPDSSMLHHAGLPYLFALLFIVLAVLAAYQYGRMKVARELLAGFERSAAGGGEGE